MTKFNDEKVQETDFQTVSVDEIDCLYLFLYRQTVLYNFENNKNTEIPKL